MPPFRLGLIGAGRMGRTHLRALAASSTVTACPDRERMKVAACALTLCTGPAMLSAMSIR